MPVHTVTSAIPTDRVIASIGRAVSDLAAAAGPIIRLNISRAPTTGTVMLVARAITSRNASSIRRDDTPRASATSGIVEDSSSGRNMTMIAAMHTPPSATKAVTPAITATAVAAIQVFSIRPENIPAPHQAPPGKPPGDRGGAGR